MFQASLCPSSGEQECANEIKVLTIYDMIYLSTAIGLPPGGSSTVHIYTQTIHRTTQLMQTIRRTTQLTNLLLAIPKCLTRI